MGDRLIKLIRLVVGKMILSWDKVFPARQEFKRAPELQSKVDEETKALVLYQFEACPFCLKVRRAIRRLDLKIELRDAKQSGIADEVKQGGGELQVPCLKVNGASTQWMYESDDIIAYLTHRFHNPSLLEN